MSNASTNTKHGEIQMLFEKAKELGWKIDHEGDNDFRFNKFSPAGQDFGVSIDTEGDPVKFLHNLFQAYENYDCSQEAYLWLDSDGHGKNGAPYNMKDVYEDMEACEGMIEDLYDELNSCHNEICEEE